MPFCTPLKLALSSRLVARTAILAALAACFAAPGAFSQASPASSQPAPPPKSAPPTAKISGLAHRLLETGLQTNSLSGAGLKPWHLKATFQTFTPGNPTPVTGTMEQWSAGPDQWRRSFSGIEPGLNSTVWRAAATERYQSRPRRVGPEQFRLDLHIARPVLAPLERALSIAPEYELDLNRAKIGGLALNCVSVVNPARYVDSRVADWFFPTVCFDANFQVRVVSTPDTLVQLDDIQPFQNRAVARSIKVTVKGKLAAQIKVTLLEPLAAADAGLVVPPKDAIPMPWMIEPGARRPEPAWEVGAHLPLQDDGYPYRGVILAMLEIRKDGRIKLDRAATVSPHQDVLDAIELAVNRWKYKPYLVNGQPVDAEVLVPYVMDGKPFVPSYSRSRPAVPVNPEDYAALATGGFADTGGSRNGGRRR